MASARRLLGRLSERLRRRTLEKRLDEELRGHLELLAEDYVSKGLSREAAERKARLTLGGVEQTSEAVRDERALWVDPLWQDVKYAGRSFRKRAVVFGIMTAGLAVTIALCGALFSVVNAVGTSSSGIRGASALRRLMLAGSLSLPAAGYSFEGSCGYADFADLKENLSSMSLVATAEDMGVIDIPGGPPERQFVAAVSGDFLRLLDVRAYRGRTLGPRDDAPGAPWVAVVTYGFWINRLDGDPNIVGKTIHVDGQAFTIVGVIERRFRLSASRGFGVPAVLTTFANKGDGWRERKAAAAGRNEAEVKQLKGLSTLSGAQERRLQQLKEEASAAAGAWSWNPLVAVFGRVAAGVSQAAAEAEVSAHAETRLETFGKKLRPGFKAVRFEPLDRPMLPGIATRGMAMLPVGLLLFLSCANVTNLLLANAISRAREIAVRRALGANGARIARQLLTESVLLGLGAGVCGYLGTVWLVPVLAASLRTGVTVDVSPDIAVYAFLAALVLLVGIASGLAPARFGRRDDLLPGLGGSLPAGGPVAGRGLRSLLLGAQAAISVALLAIGALLAQSLIRAGTLDIGYDIDRLVVIAANPRRASSNPDGERWFWQAAPDRVRQVPGVAQVAVTSRAPFSTFVVPRLPNGMAVHRVDVSADYFKTLGLRLVKGRSFTPGEVDSNAPVAVLSEKLARRFWGNEDPIGSSLDRVWGEVTEDPPGSPWAGRRADTRIVGVVADSVRQVMEAEAPTIFLPLSSYVAPRLVVRSAGPRSEALAGRLRAALRELDLGADSRVTYPRDDLEQAVAPLRPLVMFGALTGVGSLLLAVMGISAVSAFLVAQRRREMSIRMSLGASPGAVLRVVLRSVLTAITVGAIVGLGCAVPAARLLPPITGAARAQPAPLVVAVALFVLVAVVAVLAPIRRALNLSLVRDLNAE